MSRVHSLQVPELCHNLGWRGADARLLCACEGFPSNGGALQCLGGTEVGRLQSEGVGGGARLSGDLFRGVRACSDGRKRALAADAGLIHGRLEMRCAVATIPQAGGARGG